MKHLNTFYFCLLVSFFFQTTSCNAPEQSESEITDATSNQDEVKQDSITSIYVNLIELDKNGLLPEPVNIEISYDHFFKKSKSYRAYPFNELLQPFLSQLGVDDQSDAVVTFTCTDGYQPTQKVRDLLSAEGYLAFKDLSVTDPNLQWQADLQEKLAPYYLVWKDIPEENKLLGWPYALVSFKIDKVDKIYAPITPKNNERALAGFGLYKQNCIKCHSINMIGGNLGPDFNYPKNITAYWSNENIKAFIKNPQSFRYNSKMPAVAHLDEKDLDLILTYLESMKSIRPPDNEL